MEEELKVALIQSELVWESSPQNIANFTEKIGQILEEVDIIFLPEMFSTGFTMHPERVAENMQGKTVQWMLETAALKNTVIAGSVAIEDNGKYYNRFVYARPDGSMETYDKRHTFTLAGEDEVYDSGANKVIIDINGWKICPQVCYDLRFPVWARNVEDYDVLVYVANWPAPRISAWDALLKARAIENMSYCIGVNRVGLDANNHEYPGHSAVYDGLGELQSGFKANSEQTQVITLSKVHLKTIREKLRFLDDRDRFNLVD